MRANIRFGTTRSRTCNAFQECESTDSATLDRRSFLRIVAAFAAVAAAPQARAGIERGRHYVPVHRPQPQAADGKIEVLEFFSYTCPHCYRLEATIEPWSRRLPKDVEFRRVPVTFNEAARTVAKAYYAAKAMDVLDKIHLKLFAAIHDEHRPLVREEALLDWMAQQGVDRERFAAMMQAFAVQGQLTRATQLMTAYEIVSVPSVVIGGRYLTSAAHAGNQQALPDVMDALIRLAQTEARNSQ